MVAGGMAMNRKRNAGVVALLLALLVVTSAVGDETHKLVAPVKGKIPVAFVVTDGAVMIDFAGPWEVFQDVMIDSRGLTMDDQMPFSLYTVSDSRKPIRASGGMQIIPDYTFSDAPPPRVVVVPAQGGKSPEMLAWIRKMSTQSDVEMSVCVGAFKLGAAGVLNGKKATTHHGAFERFQRVFPEVTLVRGKRYVQSDPVVFTAGGLSSGIDLALHVVELYFGRSVATATARDMEYEGTGWMGDGSALASAPPSPAQTTPVTRAAVSHGILGDWRGQLAAADGGTLFVLHVSQDNDGKLTATFDSPDEGVAGVAVDTIVLKEHDLHFEIAKFHRGFDGHLDQDQSQIDGSWKQPEGALPLVFRRVAPM